MVLAGAGKVARARLLVIMVCYLVASSKVLALMAGNS
jgi:hypothetical protein